MLSPERVERWAGTAAMFSIAMIALMLANPSFSNAARPKRIPDPVLALQMARDIDDVDAVLSDAPGPDREVMRVKQYEDFGFIAGYAVLYALFGTLLWKNHRRLAVAAAALGIAAAGLDIAENVAILRLVDAPLRETTQAMIDAVRHRSIVKWACGFVSLGFSSIYFFADRRRTARATGVVYVAAACLGLYGLYNNSVLIVAPLLILIGLCGTAVTFLFQRPFDAQRRGA